MELLKNFELKLLLPGKKMNGFLRENHVFPETSAAYREFWCNHMICTKGGGCVGIEVNPEELYELAVILIEDSDLLPVKNAKTVETVMHALGMMAELSLKIEWCAVEDVERFIGEKKELLNYYLEELQPTTKVLVMDEMKKKIIAPDYAADRNEDLFLDDMLIKELCADEEKNLCTVVLVPR